MNSVSLNITAPESVRLHDQVVVHVVLDTYGSKINALAGTLHIPDALTIVRVEKSNDLVPLWIEEPHAPASTATSTSGITWSGIIPGGYTGSHNLFDVVVSGSHSGTATLTVSDIQVYGHDAQASVLPSTSVPIHMRITSQEGHGIVPINDSIPPEPFTVYIGNSPHMFEGHPFAVFATEDKQTGIDHYEASFSSGISKGQGQWQRVTSPFEIPPDGRGHILSIRAVDRAGNMTVEQIATGGYYPRMVLFSIIGVLILWVLFSAVRKRMC